MKMKHFKLTHFLNSLRKNRFLHYCWRVFLRKKIGIYDACEKRLRGKKGFEVGGPSSIFSNEGLIPLYPVVKHLDNCNFSQTTVWEGNIQEGPYYCNNQKQKLGCQYIAEATALNMIPSATYDFVLSSHVLEHIANPLRALHEWIRILKQNGVIILIVPFKEKTFDHNRPVTTLDHIIEDYQHSIGEDDLSHLPEILELHDLNMNPETGSFDNFNNRCLHHHVFDKELATAIMDYVGLQIRKVGTAPPFHIIVVGEKGQEEA